MRYGLIAMLPMLLSSAAAQGLILSSPDFADGGAINKEQAYTRCGGGNLSPALSWSGAPAGTKSFAITAIDLDVKPNEWSHWIVVGLPPSVNSLGKGTPLPAGAKAAMTDFGDEAYGGPCPPAGSGVHHYQFTVWALGTANVQFPAHANAKDVAATLGKNALAKVSITGTYQR
jgi:hypothetical protein